MFLLFKAQSKTLQGQNTKQTYFIKTKMIFFFTETKMKTLNYIY